MFNVGMSITVLRVRTSRIKKKRQIGDHALPQRGFGLSGITFYGLSRITFYEKSITPAAHKLVGSSSTWSK
jgi:hypothetical protein